MHIEINRPHFICCFVIHQHPVSKALLHKTGAIFANYSFLDIPVSRAPFKLMGALSLVLAFKLQGLHFCMPFKCTFPNSL